MSSLNCLSAECSIESPKGVAKLELVKRVSIAFRLNVRLRVGRTSFDSFVPIAVSIAFRLNVRLREKQIDDAKQQSSEVSIAFRLNVRLRDRLGDDLVVLVLEVSQLPFG